jgi:hypothetical protein
MILCRIVVAIPGRRIAPQPAWLPRLLKAQQLPDLHRMVENAEHTNSISHDRSICFRHKPVLYGILMPTPNTLLSIAQLHHLAPDAEIKRFVIRKGPLMRISGAILVAETDQVIAERITEILHDDGYACQLR